MSLRKLLESTSTQPSLPPASAREGEAGGGGRAGEARVEMRRMAVAQGKRGELVRSSPPPRSSLRLLLFGSPLDQGDLFGGLEVSDVPSWISAKKELSSPLRHCQFVYERFVLPAREGRRWRRGWAARSGEGGEGGRQSARAAAFLLGRRTRGRALIAASRVVEANPERLAAGHCIEAALLDRLLRDAVYHRGDGP